MKTIKVNANLEDVKTCRMNKPFCAMRHDEPYKAQLNLYNALEEYKAKNGVNEELLDLWVKGYSKLVTYEYHFDFIFLNTREKCFESLNRFNVQDHISSYASNNSELKEYGGNIMKELGYNYSEQRKVFDSIYYC